MTPEPKLIKDKIDEYLRWNVKQTAKIFATNYLSIYKIFVSISVVVRVI